MTRWHCDVGPQSVGPELMSRALCRGGGTLTASDVAVMLGKMQLAGFGGGAAAASGVVGTAAPAETASHVTGGTSGGAQAAPSPSLLQAAWDNIQEQLSDLLGR